MNIFSILCLFYFSACASTRMQDTVSDELFKKKEYVKAAQRLEEGLKSQPEDSKDALLYHLDIGLAWHSAKEYSKSNTSLQAADKIADIKDYTSISQEAASVVATDQLKDYKGEDFENILINTYLAMNYVLMGNIEDALVEVRRVNHKINVLRQKNNKIKESAFIRYLSSILYEMDKNYDSAYLDAKRAYELCPEYKDIGFYLWRLAKQIDNIEDQKIWVETFNFNLNDLKKREQEIQQEGYGELIVLYENGISPEKKPNPDFMSLPKFYRRYNPITTAQVVVNNNVIGTTYSLENIEENAIQTLDEKYSALIARKTTGKVLKGVAGFVIAEKTDSPLLGLLTYLLLDSLDKADLRSWKLLPKDLQIGRFWLKPGEYRVRVKPFGYTAIESFEDERILITRRGKTFVNFRYLP